MSNNPPNFGSQHGKAKSQQARIVAQISRIVRKEGLDHDDWRYVAKKVRQACELAPGKRPKRLPRVLNADEFRRFYSIVDRAEDVQHSLMLRLLFYTAVRVSELCNMLVTDVDLKNCKVRINLGKGSKDRYVLFGKASPRHCEPILPPIPTTDGCFRLSGHLSSRPAEFSKS